MKSKCLIYIFLTLILITAYSYGGDQIFKPVPVSPGGDNLVIIENRCPTFSWTSVDRAAGYRVAVFRAHSRILFSYDEMAALQAPVLHREIRGKAFSWTPSSAEGLVTGWDYVWYVQAVDETGFGNWSPGKIFRVELPLIAPEMEEQIKERLREEGLSEETIGDIFAGAAPGEEKEEETPDGASGYEGVDETYYGSGAGNGTAGSNNSFFGVNSGGVIAAGGEQNSTFGDNAGNSLTTGDDNCFFGYYSGQSVVTGTGNSFFGRSAGNQNTASYNTMIGWNAGWENLTGTQNVFVGSEAGKNNTTADSNVFVGYKSGITNTTGEQNTFVGTLTGEDNTTGSYNTFLGHDSGWESTTGNENTFLGYATGLYNSTGYSNTLVGAHAGYYNGTGYNNTYLGMHAGHGTGPYNHNVFIGYKAGYFTQESQRLCIDVTDTTTPLIYGEFDNNLVQVNGNLTMSNTGTTTYFTVDRTDGSTFKLAAGVANTQIGSISNHGIKFTTNNTWKMQLNANGTLSMADGGSYNGTWNDASSIEYKENIRELSSDEAKVALEELNPVIYNYKKYKDEERAGFIAEHVPEIVANNDRKNISTMDIVAVLTKVVKEQQKVITEQNRAIAEMKEFQRKIAEDLKDLRKKGGDGN